MDCLMIYQNLFKMKSITNFDIRQRKIVKIQVSFLRIKMTGQDEAQLILKYVTPYIYVSILIGLS